MGASPRTVAEVRLPSSSTEKARPTRPTRAKSRRRGGVTVMFHSTCTS